MKLPLVFVWGFVVSLAVVGAAIWLFAAYETANWWPWTAEPRLSQNEWFEVVRNAVTTAAALGVGVTLFFSYRRQQTAEMTQRIGADAQVTASEAQKIAAKALELSNKQHTLDQERRNDAVTSELRLRYGKAAEHLGSEQLPLRLAGIYSLASLADDWAEVGNLDERQVCIDLLGAYYKSLGSIETVALVADECKAAALDVVKSRISRDTPNAKFWGSSKIRLENVGQLAHLHGMALDEGGSLTLRGINFGFMTMLSNVQLSGGRLQLSDIRSADNGGGMLHLSQSFLTEGALRIFGGSLQEGAYAGSSIRISNVIFDGASLSVGLPGSKLEFRECKFLDGNVNLSGRFEAISFVSCHFEKDVFAKRRKASLRGNLPFMASKLTVKDATYAAGVPELEPY